MSSAPAQNPAPETGKPAPASTTSPAFVNQKVAVAVVFVAAMFLNIMDTTIVNVALPTLARQFSVTPAAADAVVVGYLISLAVFIPASGWLGDRWGTKRIFLIALAVFTLASAACGLAQSLGQLVAFRVAQGIGGGMLTPVGMAMLYRVFPPAERLRAARILQLPIIVAPATGPVIGGLLIDQLSWRWAFYVNVPIGLAAFLFGLFALTESREQAAGKFDLRGFILAGVGSALLMYALTQGPVQGWDSPLIVSTGIAGLATLVLLVVSSLRLEAPMLDFRLLAVQLFARLNLVSFFISCGFMGLLFLVPLLVQDARGGSPLTSGLLTIPEAFGVVTAGQIVIRIYHHVGPRRLISGGLTSLGIAIVTLGSTYEHLSNTGIVAIMYWAGLSVGCVFLPMQTAAFVRISRPSMGRASALFNAQRQFGSAFGVAILSSVLVLAGFVPGADHAAISGAFAPAFYVSAAMAFLGALVGLTVPDNDSDYRSMGGKPKAEGKNA
jgi:EmrB/QacA subfamily drug resistance transporter